jgi:hypothetical protein
MAEKCKTPGRHRCTGRDGVQQANWRDATHRPQPAPIGRSSTFARFFHPPDVIVLPVRWCLHFALSYRDIEELLAERGIEVDHTTIYRWVQRFTPLLTEAARPCRHAVGARWQIDVRTPMLVGGQFQPWPAPG